MPRHHIYTAIQQRLLVPDPYYTRGCWHRQVLLLCGHVEEKLSDEMIRLEVATEDRVLKPLATILEDDIPLIEKLRRQLDSRTLDMDAAKTRSATHSVLSLLISFFWFSHE